MNVKLYKIVLFLFFIVLFSSCLNRKKIELKYHEFDYKFVLHANDLYFKVDLFFLKEYFVDNSFIGMSYFVDSLVLNNAKYIDVSLLYNDIVPVIASLYLSLHSNMQVPSKPIAMVVISSLNFGVS